MLKEYEIFDYENHKNSSGPDTYFYVIASSPTKAINMFLELNNIKGTPVRMLTNIRFVVHSCTGRYSCRYYYSLKEE